MRLPARQNVMLVPFLALALVAASAPCLRAQQAAASSADEDVVRLRAELQALRAEYTARLAALEARLDALAAAGATPTTGAASPAPAGPGAPVAPPAVPQPATEPAVPAGAAGAGGASGSLPTYGPATSKVFNPDIAVIGNFVSAAGQNTSDDAWPSLRLDEAETSFQAVVDPYARADFFLAFNPEGVEIEEGYLTFPTLPGDFLMKVGKMRAAFGKANSFHNHNRPWVDQPLVSQNLVGGEEGLSDSGFSLARLFPNDFVFLEATGEVLSGHSSVFAAPRRSDLSYVGRLRAYRDLSESTNLDLGASISYGNNGLTDRSKTRLIGGDLAFRWRPLRRARYRGFIGRAELVWSRLEQEASVQKSFGLYASAEYQLTRRWFAGLRYDLSDRAHDASIRDEGLSALVTFWPSEFSQIRAQFRRTAFGDRDCANELLLQFLFSIGAHGAHPF